MRQAGLVLALLGGVRKCVGALDAVPLRGDIHILMCGDPGLGKSQLLQVCSSIAVLSPSKAHVPDCRPPKCVCLRLLQ